ncbi:MFS siderochrome iron transporter 1 [Ophidiomyces ophidiicola]|nr:MFS siderochrome iron transporter 1 [Ophidiomyces ophidiicola]KAI2132712.1 MFS siderochrome iron transporter 1 [Ophidiomyces ophidiicola]KAI2211404.1 MFS siderochrome iron transporter 1 [Ophidiomyces ophidiicola]KAI2345865.1 MFS siderochrome iron transporter 1 [Ophidiomyces ophidiicola]KAI2422905.1 MFS siderochrome iron transporter 1 [Ophidiomyces ophidiicola]
MGEHNPHPSKIPYWRQVAQPGVVTQEIIDYPYDGLGTENDPYIVEWLPNDPRNPLLLSNTKKWFITMLVAMTTLAVALISSAYTGGGNQIMREFRVGTEVMTLGVSLFVLGFAIGPLLWAPLSELFGRQIIFFGTYMALTAFNAGAAGSQNIWTLIILRFFAGSFGSSPLTNAGGIIADMFSASERGLAMGMFSLAPFLGPVLGPIIGGFIGMNEGWRWVEGFLAIFSGVLWIFGSLLIPETYAPVLLRKRAVTLSKLSGKVYRSRIDIDQGRVTVREAFITALSRPWILLLREPIVLLLSIYLAIIYGTLYMLFGAFPFVYQLIRGWNEGVGGLAFLGILVGMLIAAVVNFIDNNSRYLPIARKHHGFAPPEARLPPSIIGGIAIPIGLFWFAWTNDPSIHWLASIAAGVPFGFGMVLVFLGVMSYLIDAYTIYAASVLAASSVLRSLFGAAFPLFTRYMYEDLGIHWASSIPAFLALACVPFPFLFYKYGGSIRKKCRFAAEAEEFMHRFQQGHSQQKASSIQGEEAEGSAETTGDEAEKSRPLGNARETGGDDGYFAQPTRSLSRQATHRTHRTHRAGSVGSQVASEYEGNPFDIDRVNTRTSVMSGRRVSTSKR